LPGGQEKIQALLSRLPDCLNWQIAFYGVFKNEFSRPIEVEKWWSLRAIDFAAHAATSQWTLADSDERLAELLQVPVQIRGDSNSLPWHTEISLQSAIRELGPGQRDAVLSDRLRDLELAQFRLARPFAILAAGYRDVLRDFLGGSNNPRVMIVNRRAPVTKRLPVRDTLRKLDALDTHRRELAARLNFNPLLQNGQSANR